MIVNKEFFQSVRMGCAVKEMQVNVTSPVCVSLRRGQEREESEDAFGNGTRNGLQSCEQRRPNVF